MILGNLAIFVVVIVIVCAVDLSSLSLDESTEKLLYYDTDEVTGSAEDSAENKDTVSNVEPKEENTADNTVYEEDKIENSSDKEKFDFPDVDSVAEYDGRDSHNMQHVEAVDGLPSAPAKGNAIEERKPHGHIYKKINDLSDTRNGIPVSSLEDALGMHTDFDDDFKDINCLIREIHDGGSPS